MLKKVVFAVLLLSSIGLNSETTYKELPDGWIQFAAATGAGYFFVYQKDKKEDATHLQFVVLPTAESCLSAIQISSRIIYDPNFVFNSTNMACGLATEKRLEMDTTCQTQSDGTDVRVTYFLDKNSKEESSRVLEALASDNEFLFRIGTEFEHKFSLRGSAHVVNLIREQCRISNG